MATLSLSGVAIHAFLPKLLSKISPSENLLAGNNPDATSENTEAHGTLIPTDGGFAPRQPAEPQVQYHQRDMRWGTSPGPNMIKESLGIADCYLPSDFRERTEKRKTSPPVRQYKRASGSPAEFWLSVHEKKSKDGLKCTEWEAADLLQYTSDNFSSHRVEFSSGLFNGYPSMKGTWTAKKKSGETIHYSSFIIPIDRRYVWLTAWAESSAELTEMENALQMTQFVATTP